MLQHKLMLHHVHFQTPASPHSSPAPSALRNISAPLTIGTNNPSRKRFLKGAHKAVPHCRLVPRATQFFINKNPVEAYTRLKATTKGAIQWAGGSGRGLIMVKAM